MKWETSFGGISTNGSVPSGLIVIIRVVWVRALGVRQRWRKQNRVPSGLKSRWLNQCFAPANEAWSQGIFTASAIEKIKVRSPVLRSIRQMPASVGAATSLLGSAGSAYP